MNIPSYVYTKTFWAGVVSIITAVGGYFTGELTTAEALPLISTGIIGIFLRSGMATETKQIELDRQKDECPPEK